MNGVTEERSVHEAVSRVEQGFFARGCTINLAIDELGQERHRRNPMAWAEKVSLERSEPVEDRTWFLGAFCEV